jgi:amino acid adenylation domain-containing protein/thioester reductase-like protein
VKGRLGARFSKLSRAATLKLQHIEDSEVQSMDRPNDQGIGTTASAGSSASGTALGIGADAWPLIALDRHSTDAIAQAVPGGMGNVQDVYPLSPLQEGMLLQHIMQQGGDAYALSKLFEVHDRVEVQSVIDAVQSVVDRHDALRSAVLWEQMPRPLQVVYKKAMLSVTTVSLEDAESPADEMRLRMKPTQVTWDLRHAPLIRLEVGKCARAPHWYALVLVHHIVCDHRSRHIIVQEILAHLEGRGHELQRPEPFKAYVTRAVMAKNSDEAQSFFKSQLADVGEPTVPFGVGSRSDVVSIREFSQEVDLQLCTRIRTRARQFGVTAARLFHAAWSLVVSFASGRDDVVFGTVVLAKELRTVTETEMLGLAVNTVPLRMRLKCLSCGDLVRKADESLSEVLKWENVPLTVAQSCSGIGSGSALFGCLLNYRRSGGAASRDYSDHPREAARVVATGEAYSEYAVALLLDDFGDRFVLTAQTAAAIDPARIVSMMIAACDSLTGSLERRPQSAALALAVVSEMERELVVRNFNQTGARYPKEKTVQEVFEEQVLEAPDALAVVCNGEYLTYSELNRKANRLAHFLISQGIRTGDYVPIALSRSLDLLTAQIAVLKAGAVYVPVDLTLPGERQLFIVMDTGARVGITDTRRAEKLVDGGVRWLDCISCAKEIEGMPDHDLKLAPKPHLAYVMYTSGSTGVPKGVVVPHRAVIRLALNNGYAEIGPADRIAHHSNPAFDASTFEVWCGLLNGAGVVVVPQETVFDPAAFESLLRETKVTALWITVGLLARYADALTGVFGQLRYLISGGDVFEPGIVERLMRQRRPRHVLNGYGPTECTTFTTTYEIEGVPEGTKSFPIGRPMSNARVYVLNEYLQPVPVGAQGELYIGGDGVAWGYLNRPDLSAERFIADPFGAEPGGRLYRTGDLGRWNPDGTIGYLGRIDTQVKIRGFRIELGEIETHLASHVQVREVVVVAQQDSHGERRLVAYVTPEKSAEDAPPLSAQLLRDYLGALLPKYMVPSAFMILDKLPLTPNGKVDRRALPAPVADAFVSRAFEAPLGEVEEIVAGIWQSLLGLEQVGRNDNFFELGGHSLLLVQMMDRVRQRGLAVDVRLVFESPTLAELARVLEQATGGGDHVPPPNLIPAGCEVITPEMLPLVKLDSEQIGRIVEAVPGGAANVQDIYPLAPLQEGILFHHLVNETDADPYARTILLAVSSREQLDVFRLALQRIIDRHDALRTAVIWEGLPQAVQVVHRKADLIMHGLVLDANRETVEQLRERMAPGRVRLDVRCSPLIRLEVAYGAKDGRWYALLSTHHLVCDNQSLDLLLSELISVLAGREESLPPPDAYRNHVVQALTQYQRSDSAKFFRQKLGSVQEPTLPFGLSDMHGDGSQSKVARQIIEPRLARRVRTQSRRMAVSAATLLHAAWALVVAHTSGRDDIIFGTVLLGRMQGDAGAQRIVGLFINTLPLRVQLKGVTAKGLLERMQLELIQLLSHEQASLAVAQRCSGVAAPAPLFSALLNYRHGGLHPDKQWSRAPGVTLIASEGRTNYPILLSVDDDGEDFAMEMETDERVSPAQVLCYMHRAVDSLVMALEQAPEMSALGLTILPAGEREKVTELFNATHRVYPEGELIHLLFEAQVERTPDVVAVVAEGRTITYRDLNRAANQLAHYLGEQGVGPEKLVALFVERSVEMVIGLLGVIKAGGAYVPVDPSYPAERLGYMLQDSSPKVVLTQSRLRSQLPPTDALILELDKHWSDIAQRDSDNLDPCAIGLYGNSLAYVIYTSGSTGKPKGAMNEHRAVVNRLRWMQDQYEMNQADRVLQKTPFSFDVSVWEFFWTLMCGARLIMARPEGHKDPAYLQALIAQENVTTLHFVPSMLQVFLGQYKVGECPSITHVVCSGEALSTALRDSCLKSLPQAQLSNLYGPTEAAVDVTAWECVESSHGPQVPIGHPIANARIYILDGENRPVPVGVAGEVYIGGVAVGRGYLNRPDLTAERFLPDPFAAERSARMYRTGDLGRWRPDGNVEYLGRNDHQVKIRGFRIELGEIEAKLLQHAIVSETVVVSYDGPGGDKRLVAYVVLEKNQNRENEVPEELRAYLRDSLPDYMVPSAFVPLERLPLSQNGKLDRRALPPPPSGSYVRSQYEAPQDDTERKLAEIWQALLQVGQVGRHDNFFDLGGHSLLALRLLFEVHTCFECKLNVSDVYKTPTLAELAMRIGTGMSSHRELDLEAEAVLDSDIVTRSDARFPSVRRILLTGATGFVGRFLLLQLLRDTDAIVYCLVRAKSQQHATSRVGDVMSKYGLWSHEMEARVVALPGDISVTRFGLDEASYHELVNKISSVYHCATSMNHLETYWMAKLANVGSVKELLRFCAHGTRKTFNYISTLSVFGASSDGTPRVVDELTSIDGEMHAADAGYVATKWVGEKLTMIASGRGIPCNIFRLGLIWADTQRGTYDERQREYRLLKSSFLSGVAISEYGFPMPPTPVDYAARAVVFLAERRTEMSLGIFHISSNEQGARGLFERCNEITGAALKLVSRYDWIREIKRLHESSHTLPIVPLIESTFSMSEAVLQEQDEWTESLRTLYSCARTHGELEKAGIVCPLFDDKLLTRHLEWVFASDPELRAWSGENVSTMGQRKYG